MSQKYLASFLAVLLSFSLVAVPVLADDEGELRVCSSSELGVTPIRTQSYAVDAGASEDSLIATFADAIIGSVSGSYVNYEADYFYQKNALKKDLQTSSLSQGLARLTESTSDMAYYYTTLVTMNSKYDPDAALYPFGDTKATGNTFIGAWSSLFDVVVPYYVAKYPNSFKYSDGTFWRYNEAYGIVEHDEQYQLPVYANTIEEFGYKLKITVPAASKFDLTNLNVYQCFGINSDGTDKSTCYMPLLDGDYYLNIVDVYVDDTLILSTPDIRSSSDSSIAGPYGIYDYNSGWLSNGSFDNGDWRVQNSETGQWEKTSYWLENSGAVSKDFEILVVVKPYEYLDHNDNYPDLDRRWGKRAFFEMPKECFACAFNSSYRDDIDGVPTSNQCPENLKTVFSPYASSLLFGAAIWFTDTEPIDIEQVVVEIRDNTDVINSLLQEIGLIISRQLEVDIKISETVDRIRDVYADDDDLRIKQSQKDNMTAFEDNFINNPDSSVTSDEIDSLGDVSDGIGDIFSSDVGEAGKFSEYITGGVGDESFWMWFDAELGIAGMLDTTTQTFANDSDSDSDIVTHYYQDSQDILNRFRGGGSS